MTYRMEPGQFHGDVMNRRDIGDLIFTEDSYQSGTGIPVHHHAWPYLTFILRGEFAERCGTRSRTCSPGTLIYRPPEEEHAESFSHSSGHLLNIAVSRSLLDSLGAGTDKVGRGFSIRDGEAIGLALELHRTLHRNPAHPSEATEITLALLGDLFEPMARSSGSEPRWLRDTSERIHFGFRSGVNVADLAEAAGVHPVHLSRTFRRFHGRTITATVQKHRIEYACRALREGNTPLSVIAADAGFADQSHFTREFRRIMGSAPGAFRRAVRRGDLAVLEGEPE